MRQDDYEIIVSCIQYGAPALSTKLITAFNQTIESENTLVELRRVEAEKARQAKEAEQTEKAKAKAKAKATSVKEMTEVSRHKPKIEQMSLPLED